MTALSPFVLAHSAVVREQMVDLEDVVIDLQNEVKRLLASAAAREAYVAALRKPAETPTVAPSAIIPASAGPAGALPKLTDADLDQDGIEDEPGLRFFDAAIEEEPARTWLLDPEKH